MPYRRIFLKQVAIAAGTSLLPYNILSAAESKALRLILSGYDPVAYFTDGRPVKGVANISYDWDGGHYLFASTAHRDTFVANPDHYAPQFSGFCTTGVSVGDKAEADPQQWTIAHDTLYVFGSAAGKAKATADFTGTVARANANWPKLK